MAEKSFTQAEYNALVGALDDAVDVFKRLGKSTADAEAALSAFVVTHYFAVWRQMSR